MQMQVYLRQNNRIFLYTNNILAHYVTDHHIMADSFDTVWPLVSTHVTVVPFLFGLILTAHASENNLHLCWDSQLWSILSTFALSIVTSSRLLQ